MNSTLALYLLLVGAVLLLLSLLQPAVPPSAPDRPQRWEQRCSWAIIAAWLGVNILRLQNRAMDALATQGLSTQNKLQVALVAVAALWCAYLFLFRRISLRQIAYGAGFWMLCLVAVFGLSVLWSTWPKLTVFRVAELGLFWVVICHLFGSGNWARQLETLMWLAWLLYLAWGALLIAGVIDGASSGGYIVGLVTSNTASLLAGMLLLWTLHRCLTESFVQHAWKLPIVALTMIIFGSLATFVFAMLSIALMLTLHSRGYTRLVLVFCGICLAAVVSNVAVLHFGEVAGPLVEVTSSLSGKSRGNIKGMTGRLELWTNIWGSVRDIPWGLGFAAFERQLALGSSAVSWKAGNAHNGVLSALLGAGWLAVALVLAYFASLVARARQVVAAQQPVYLGLLLLVFLNNLTLPAVGGRLTVVLLVLMGLSHIPIPQRQAASGAYGGMYARA